MRIDQSDVRTRGRLIRNTVIQLRKRMRRVTPTAFVNSRALVSRDLVVGEYAFVGPRCKLDPGVRVGRYAMLAAEVAIIGDDHNWDQPGVPIQFSGRPSQTTTFIGDDAWVGYRALIMRGVSIGRGAIVAAHAVVTQDVADYDVVAGIPARVISQRFPDILDRERHEAMLNGPTVEPTFAQRLSRLKPGDAPSNRRPDSPVLPE